MLFSSMSFIFVFLPLVLAIYFFARPGMRNWVLLTSSLIFYAWGEPKYLAIMLLTIIINYAGALLVEHFRRYKTLLLALTIIVDLSVLGYYKYFNFLLDNINTLFSVNYDFIKVVMPIGISFYTFQAISYVIDVYRGEVRAERDFFKVALFISLFPQLVAGPIVKYHEVEEQIRSRHTDLTHVYLGARRFVIGLGKKVLLANSMGLVADRIFAIAPGQLDTSYAWLGAVAYSLQLFFDFSGYSDMAIGLGLIFGFKFPENFNYPYISQSITEFWRRWHISLSSWFRLYLYFPMGGSHCSLRRTCFNLGVVFLVTGFWHGAEWSFIIWGAWHGIFIILEKLTSWPKREGGITLHVFRHCLTLLIVLFGWVLFRAEDLPFAWEYVQNMLGLLEHGEMLYGRAYFYDNMEIFFFVIAMLFSMPLGRMVVEKFDGNSLFHAFYNFYLLAVFCLSVVFLAANTYNPFIYFRF